MSDRIAKAALLTLTLAAIAGGGRARADLIHATAQVNAAGSIDNQTGATSASASATTTFAGPPSTHASGSAFATGDPGVLVTASATSTNYNSLVQSQSSWADRVYLSGALGEPPPSYLDFFFTASGEMSGLGGPDDGPAAYLDVAALSSTPGGTYFSGRYYHDGRGIGVETGIGSGDWDTIQYDATSYDHGSYLGTYHIRVGLLSDGSGGLQGDWMVLYLATLDRMGQINGNDPPSFSFDAVRLADGRTPEEAGLSLRFDSGITSPNVQAVPEPGSFALLATGALGLLGYGRARRKRAAV